MSIKIDRNATLQQVDALWKNFRQAEDAAVLKRNTDRTLQKLTWNCAKAAAVADRSAFLERYGALRKRVVDKLISVAFRRAAQMEKQPDICQTCSVMSVGSQSSTSDYDLTVFGPQSPTIVAEFYRLFRAQFGIGPAAMFDTNVYGGPNFFQLWPRALFESSAAAALPTNEAQIKATYDTLQRSLSGKTRVAIPVFRLDNALLSTLQRCESLPQTQFCDSAAVLHLSSDRSRSKDSKDRSDTTCVWNPTTLCNTDRCWAYVALCRFFDDQTPTRARFLEQLQRSVPQTAGDIANYATMLRPLAIDRRTVDLQDAAKLCSHLPADSGESHMQVCKETNYYMKLIERAQAAEHSLYASIRRQDSLVEQQKHVDILRFSVSHSAMYGSEMYITCGAMLHVVLVRQMNFDLPHLLGREDLFGSFMENAGFTYHVFADAKSQRTDENFCVETLIAGSKYLARMLDAKRRFCDQFVNDRRLCDSIAAAYDAAETARLRARNKLHELSKKAAYEYFWRIVASSGMQLDTDECSKTTFIERYLGWLVKQIEFFYTVGNLDGSTSTK